MYRNNYTPSTGVKSRLSVYFLLIFTVFLLYTCDNVPTNTIVEEDPDQNEDITNPIPDSSSNDSTDNDGNPDGDNSDNDNPDDGDPSDGDNPDDEPNTPPASNSDFVIYDGMNFNNKPATIAQAGVKAIDVHYAGSIFGISARNLPGTMHLPDKDRVLELARETAQSGASMGVIDIEHWPIEGSADEVRQSVDNLLTVLEWFKEGAPNVEWGYYGEVPIRNYWDAIESPSSSDYQGWMEANDNLQPVANAVDVLFPSIYTFYDRQEDWATYAKAQIAEARRLNPDKPVLVYLWPEYHMSNKNGLAGQLIDREFWRMQLELAREYADGVVIYASSGFDFDPSQSWWQATEEFIQEVEG